MTEAQPDLHRTIVTLPWSLVCESYDVKMYFFLTAAALPGCIGQNLCMYEKLISSIKLNMHSSADGLCSVSFYSIKSYDCDKSWHSLGKKKKSKSCIYTVSTGEKNNTSVDLDWSLIEKTLEPSVLECVLNMKH